ncbi:MAG: hypothetical protein RLZZ631_57 [Cyanobacteriota bacterium]|jgi:hypothetical protein
MAKTNTKTKPPQASPQDRKGLTMKLQMAAGFFLPMLAIGLWLNSKGFFG